MLVIYSRNREDSLLEIKEDFLLLNSDNLGFNCDPWDDFGYKTRFKSYLYKDNKIEYISDIRILFSDKKNSHDFLDNLIKENSSNYIEFPIENINFLSQPCDIDFYEKLKTLLREDALDILEKMQDASYTYHSKNIILDNLVSLDALKNSLLRGMGEKKAFSDGWKTFNNQSIEKDIQFNIEFKLDSFLNKHNVKINFKKSILPENINILIGPNGTGKSQTLKHIIKRLLNLENKYEIDNLSKNIPFFSKIVLLSYSPFDHFDIKINEEDKNIKSLYKYYGFKNEENNFDIKNGFKESCKSLISLINDDKQNFYGNSKKKLDLLENILKISIKFDYIGVQLKIIKEEKINDKEIYQQKTMALDDEKNKFSYLSAIQLFHQEISFTDSIDFEKGIIFFKDGKQIKLSSGQIMFSIIITCIISSIKIDTLLLIDEPELYLHPSLEITLIKMLKEILSEFSSFAIISTHSSFIAREIPRDRIIVLKNYEKIISSVNPPFETFGGDLEKIGSYIFDDISIEKPFESWIKEKASEYDSLNEALEDLKAILNEESIIFLASLFKE